MTRSSRSLRTHRQRRFRAVNFESLEPRQLLAVEILSAAYKTLDFTATGALTGQTRGDIQTANDYHDDYTANLSFSGAVLYSSPTQGSGSGIGQGNGSGTENCPPEFGVLDTYAYSFDSDISIGQSGTVLEIDQTTTRFEYSNSTCTGDYSVGATPFDRAISGPLNISTMPYTAVLNFTDASSTPYPNRSQGSVNLTVTPHDDEAFNLVVDALEEDSAGILVSFASAGPTTTATAPNAAITNVQLYFASGPTPQEIIGDSLANLPVYWNSASGSMRVTDLPEAPSGASHLVAIVDRAGLLNESSEADNFLSLKLPNGGALVRHTFVIQVTSFFDNDGELADVAVGDTYFGTFEYNADTGAYGAIDLQLPAVATMPTIYFSYTADTVNDDLGLYFSTYRDGATHEWLDADFYLSGPVNGASLPRCLDDFSGTFGMSTEDGPGTSMGFVLDANVTFLSCEPTVLGLNYEISTLENQAKTVDVVARHAVESVDIDPATVKVTTDPLNGTLQVNPATGAITFTPTHGFVGFENFNYEARTVAGDKLFESSVTIEVVAIPKPYQNPLNRYWVNLGDQDISALDYNIIVNEINANGVRVLAPPTGPVTAYWDVTGDNVLAPDDAQQVATYINAFGVTTGAGEPISQREDAAARPTALVMPVAPLAAGLFAPDFTISHTAVETKAPANESPVDFILAAGPSTSDEALIDARASELSDGYWRDGVRRRADVTAALLWNGEENADWWLS